MKQKRPQSLNRPQSLGRKKEKESTTSSIYNQFKEKLIEHLQLEGLKEQEIQLRLQTIIEQTLNKQNIEQGRQDSQLELLFKDSTWRCEFHQQFLKQLNKYLQQQLNILIFVSIIAEGHFDLKFEEFSTQLVSQKAPRPLSNLFIFKYNLIDQYLLFEVGLHKNHIIENYQLIGFEIQHKITFIDIRNEFQLKHLMTSAQQYTKQIQRNPYRSDLPLITQDKGQQLSLKQNKRNLQIPCFINLKNQLGVRLFLGKPEKQKDGFHMSFPINYIQQEKFMFVDDKYISKDWLNIRKQNQQYQQCLSINKSLFQIYTDFKDASKIIDYLHTYTSFKTKLSIQERQLLEESGNIMVIGRSGTGKTTCAILRLFAIQLLLKYRIKITGQKQKIFMHSQDENQTIGLHCLFTAQNQMLVDEVKQQYKKLILDLKPDQSNQVQETDSESDWEALNPQHIYQLMVENVQQQNDIQENQSENQSLLKYRDRDFPLFLSIKELIIQLDACMNYPYLQNETFIQEVDRQLDHAGWQVGEAHQIKISLGNNQYKIIRLIEVDYNYFRTIFWPTLQNSIKKQYNSEQYKNLVWTQIYSYIKGSEYSHQYLEQGLPFQIFYNNFNQSLTLQQAQEIYDIYLSYEKWKNKQALFDRMDIVNYQINCVERFQFKQNPIHFTMIDEIQDLPHATIKLISKITEQSLYCSGDTAQNIQKGVGFRFQDLRSLLYSEDNFSDLTNDKVKLHQLTINFRSHNSILQLANNVVSLIETFFPKTIDKLKKEISEKNGPKPKIVQSNHFQTLIRILRPQNKDKQQIEQINLMGAQKVIIVRDNEAKKKINQIIDNILCLTVQEAKGLEFNDVVLFNFFMEQDVLIEQWQLLQHLKYENEKLIIDPRFNYQMNNYGPLCMELKQLYVCITRAKQRIIIFDEDCSKRIFIEQLWFQQDLVEFFKEENIFNNDQQDINKNRNLEFQKNGWKEKGIKLFEVKNYNEAMKCFRFSGDLQLEKKSKAFYVASTAQQEINQITAKWKSKQHFSRLEQEKINEDYKIITLKCYIDFEEAAQIFVEIKFYKEAGQCYFSCQQYKNALNNYLLAKEFLGAADSAFESQFYQLAGIIYLKNNYFDKSIKSFEKEQDYQMITEVLSISQYHYKTYDYQQQMNKYIPQLIEQMHEKLIKQQSELNYDQIYEYSKDLQEEFVDQLSILKSFYIPTDIEELLVFIWNKIRLNKDFIINQLDEQFTGFDKENAVQLFKTKFNRLDRLEDSHYELLLDILEYYNMNSLLTQLQQGSNQEQVQKQFYKIYNQIYRNSFLFIKDHNQILKQQPQFEEQEIKFLNSLKKDFKKQQFGILYLFGFSDFQSKFLNKVEQDQKLHYKPFIEAFVNNKIQQCKQIDHNELIKKIELILDIKTVLGWNEGVDIFHSIVQFFLQDRQNIAQENSKIYEFAEEKFRTIIVFLSFASNILKYNHSIHVQLQLFAAICQINNLTIPTYEYLRIISQSYLIYKGDEQVAKKKWKIDELIQIGQSLYLVNTNKIVKAIRQQFQEISKDLTQNYYKNSVDSIQSQLKLYQQIFQSKNKEFIETSQKFVKLTKLQRDYKQYLEKGLRQKFFLNTQFLYFFHKSYFNNSFLNLISYQLIIKSILQTTAIRRMEKIVFGIQLISYCPNQKELDVYFEKFKSTSKILNEFSQNDLEDIQYYVRAQQVLRKNYIDIDYIHYLLQSYRNPNMQSTIQRDFMTSFMYVLMMIQIIQQQNDDKKHQLLFGKISIDQKIKARAYQQFIGQFLIQDKDNHTFEVSYQFNKQILIEMFNKWMVWYLNNLKKIDESYLYILFENCNKELKDIIIKQVEESTISEQLKLKILDQGSKKDIQLEQILIKIIIKQDFSSYQEQPRQIQFQFQIIFQSIKKFELQSQSILLTASEYFRLETQFQKGIYLNKFSKCFKLVENIRQKLIFFIYKFCNSSLKFRTAMIELTELQYYQQELMSAIFNSNFNYKHIYSKLKSINLKINNWQQKNWKYKEELKRYDEKQQQDPNFIKLHRYLKLSKELNYQNNSSMNGFSQMRRNDQYN